MNEFRPPATTRTARKQHQCDNCYRAILAGESYRHANFIWDGSWISWKQCGHCAAVLDTIWNLRLIDSEEWGEDEIDECLRYSQRIPLLRMLVGMRRKWRFRSGGLMPIPDIIPRRCVDCSNPVGPTSYTWCESCDEKRIHRISGQLASLASAFEVTP